MLFTEDHTDGWTGGSVVWAVMGVNMALSASFDDFAARRVTLTSFLSRQRRGGKTPLPACAFPMYWEVGYGVCNSPSPRVRVPNRVYNSSE